VTSLTPDEALLFLKAGNERFKAGTSTHPHVGAKRLIETAAGQHPVATILSCSDSRVPPEVLFDDGIGDIFTIRVAGNVVDTDEMGSAEYGVDHLGTSLMVVMGHTKCGAVTAVATHATVHGHIPALVEHINEAVEATRKQYPSATDLDLVPEATRANVFQSIATVLRESDSVRERVESGKAQLVGAIYNVETGNVEWLGRHQDEAALIAEGKKAAAANGSGHGAKPSAKGGKDSHASASGHGVGASAVVANLAAHGAHGAAAAGTEPAAPPAPSIPSPYTFVLIALLCTIGGSISGRLTAKSG
jgi:carbonic anhydrase